MVNFGLGDVFVALAMMRSHMNTAMVMMSDGRGNDPLDEKYKEVLVNNLRHVHKFCGQNLLIAADDRVIAFWNIWSQPFTYGTLAIELKPLLEAFESDLRKQHFYHYAPHRFMHLLQMPATWAATFKKFPSVEEEAKEGVDCYALEHNTACVFHMVRVVEIGLRALAREREVKFSDKPLEWANWQPVLDQMESKAKTATKGMPIGAKKDAALAFYSGAIAQFHGFKDTFRNVTMHVRKRYDELDALRSINQVRDFMNGLSAKIGEKTRKPIPLSRWP
jgi:hypothetical protein